MCWGSNLGLTGLAKQVLSPLEITLMILGVEKASFLLGRSHIPEPSRRGGVIGDRGRGCAVCSADLGMCESWPWFPAGASPQGAFER